MEVKYKPRLGTPGLLGVAIVDPVRGIAGFVPNFEGFEPLSEKHKEAEEWVRQVNAFCRELGDNEYVLIIDYSENALRVFCTYASIFRGLNDASTVLL